MHFGGWGETPNVLNKLSKFYLDDDGSCDPSDFKTHWQRCLSGQLQQCTTSDLGRKWTVYVGARSICSSRTENKGVSQLLELRTRTKSNEKSAL